MKRNFMRSGVLALLAFSLLFTWVLDGSAASVTRKNIFMGTTSTSSSGYPIQVAAARIINRHVPEVRVTVLETGATHDNMQRMSKGQIQLAGSTGSDGAAMAYYGLFQYQEKPVKQVRVLFYERESVMLYVVRADSGVKTFRDLHGKRFHLGIPGSSAEFNSRLLFKAFGIEPRPVYGSLADGVDMVKDGRVVGLGKYAPGVTALDASMMDIKSVTPVRLISFTEEEVAKALQVVPWEARVEAQADNPMLKGIGQESLIALKHPSSNFISSEISEEIVYKMIKGIAQDWKSDMVPAYPELAHWDVVKDTIRCAAGISKPVPLHAGVVKFFIERGATVPATLLPPEWKK